jgi:hypothetical protein
VFRGRYARAGLAYNAIYRRLPDGQVVPIADAGAAQSVPGQSASSRFYKFEHFHYVTADGAAVLNAMNTNFDLGVYRSTPEGSLTKVYDRFDPVPTVGPVVQPLVYLAAANNAGHVAVTNAFWEGGQQHVGVVLVDPDGATRLIDRTAVNGGPHQYFSWYAGLTEAGDLLYSALLPNERWEVLRYRHATGALETVISPGMTIDGMTVEDCWIDAAGRTSGDAAGFADDGSFVAHVQLNGRWGMYLFPGFDDGCYPDCNADGQLTVADFGCFQTRFVAADPYADCNADGSLTVADYGCFQTEFVSGCP